jgi:hypothetical protein
MYRSKSRSNYLLTAIFGHLNKDVIINLISNHNDDVPMNTRASHLHEFLISRRFQKGKVKFVVTKSVTSNIHTTSFTAGTVRNILSLRFAKFYAYTCNGLLSNQPIIHSSP